MGVTQSKSSTRRLIDELCNETDQEMLKYQGNLNKELTQAQTPTNRQNQLDDSSSDDSDYLPMMDDMNDTVATVSSLDSVETVHMSTSEQEEKAVGYAFVWDNIQKLSQVRNSANGRSNIMHLWANAFAAVNRVNPQELDDNDICLRASSIPLSAYLPSIDDRDMLRERMTCIVSRILVTHLAFFKEYNDVVTWHILHEYSPEMSQKSTIINIGIIDQDPSTRSGTLEIMLKLQQFVPRRQDGQFRVVPCHGDGMAVERMVDAQKARSADASDVARIEGLSPCPQEFHHRGIMLQDTMNLLFNGASVGERATLAQIRNAYQHRNASPKEVMHSFNACENLLRFATEAHIIYLAMTLLGIDTILDTPHGFNPRGTKAERQHDLQSISQKIIDVVWLLPGPDDIRSVWESEVPDSLQETWCFCQLDIEGQLIKCSNPDCPLGRWFHTKCVGLDDWHIPTGDWWCSSECRDTGSSDYCLCKKVMEDEMVPCGSPECNQGQLFHLTCINRTELPDGPWYCSLECSNVEGQKRDHVKEYAVALTWYGLLDLSHRDAIREGDGLAMLSMWRIDMPRFWAGNHYKYLILGHRLLSGVNGFLPPRLIEEILHNRTCNLKGGPGRNVAMDRVNEFLNNEFEETLSHAHGNYSVESVRRAGKLVGTLARAIDEAFHVNVSDVCMENSYHHRFNYNEDIQSFIGSYWEDQLFTNHPGRTHATFPDFCAKDDIINQKQLKQRLIKYSANLDKLRDVLEM